MLTLNIIFFFSSVHQNYQNKSERFQHLTGHGVKSPDLAGFDIVCAGGGYTDLIGGV